MKAKAPRWVLTIAFKKHGASVEFWTIYYWDPIYHRFRGRPIDAASALELTKNAMHPDLHK